MKITFSRIALAVALAVIVARAAPAQESGHEDATAEAHESSLLTDVFKWLNLAVLVGGLGYLLKAPLQQFLAERGRQVEEGLENARLAESQAAQRLAEAESRLSSLSREIEGLRESMERDAQAEAQRIIEEANREVAGIIEQSKGEMDRLARAAERSVRAKLADLIVSRTEQHLRETMNEQDKALSVAKSLQKLGARSDVGS